jgi:hypothetical protein
MCITTTNRPTPARTHNGAPSPGWGGAPYVVRCYCLFRARLPCPSAKPRPQIGAASSIILAHFPARRKQRRSVACNPAVSPSRLPPPHPLRVGRLSRGAQFRVNGSQSEGLGGFPIYSPQSRPLPHPMGLTRPSIGTSSPPAGSSSRRQRQHLQYQRAGCQPDVEPDAP